MNALYTIHMTWVNFKSFGYLKSSSILITCMIWQQACQIQNTQNPQQLQNCPHGSWSNSDTLQLISERQLIVPIHIALFSVATMYHSKYTAKNPFRLLYIWNSWDNAPCNHASNVPQALNGTKPTAQAYTLPFRKYNPHEQTAWGISWERLTCLYWSDATPELIIRHQICAMTIDELHWATVVLVSAQACRRFWMCNVTIQGINNCILNWSDTQINLTTTKEILRSQAAQNASFLHRIEKNALPVADLILANTYRISTCYVFKQVNNTSNKQIIPEDDISIDTSGVFRALGCNSWK